MDIYNANDVNVTKMETRETDLLIINARELEKWPRNGKTICVIDSLYVYTACEWELISRDLVRENKDYRQIIMRQNEVISWERDRYFPLTLRRDGIIVVVVVASHANNSQGLSLPRVTT